MAQISYCDFSCGWISGMGGVVVGHPMDTIKVKQQVTGSTILEVFRQVYNARGFSGFFRGMAAPIISSGVLNSVFFGAYEAAFRLLQDKRIGKYESVFLAGCFGGTAQLFLACPVDLLKIQLQNHQHKKDFRGPVHCSRQIIKTHGLFGLYKGFSVQVLRDVPSSGLYFLMYEYGKHNLSRGKNDCQISQFVAGGVAGIASWLCILPLDVIKSKIQGHEIGKSSCSSSQAIKEVYSAQGWRGFFRGFYPLCIRAFPVNGTIFLLYEWMNRHCLSVFFIETA